MDSAPLNRLEGSHAASRVAAFSGATARVDGPSLPGANHDGKDHRSDRRLEASSAASEVAIHSQPENSKAPIVHADKKSGNKSVARSTISELLHQGSSSTSASGMSSNPRELGMTASGSAANDRGVALRIGTDSHEPPAAELHRSAKGMEQRISVADGNAHHQLQSEGGQPTVASAPGSVHSVPTYVGRAIYRRSPAAAPPAGGFRAPERAYTSRETSARPDLSQPASPRVCHAGDGTDAGSQLGGAGEQVVPSGKSEVLATPVSRETQTADSEAQIFRKPMPMEATLALAATEHFESGNGVVQTSIASSRDRSMADPLGRVMRTVTSQPVAGPWGSTVAKDSKSSLPGVVGGEPASAGATHTTPGPLLGTPGSPVSHSTRQSGESASSTISRDSASRPVQWLRDARTVNQAEPSTNSRSGRIELQRVAPDQAVSVLPLEPMAGVRQIVIHRSPQVASTDLSTTLAPRSGDDASAMDSTGIVLSRQAESQTIPAEGGSGSFVTPILRSLQSEPRNGAGDVALEMKSAVERAALGSGVVVGQSNAAKAQLTAPESQASATTAASVARQFLLPGGPSPARSTDAIPDLSRIVRLSPSGSLSRSSGRLDVPAGLFRSAFTHRSLRAIDTLQSSSDFAMAVPSFPLKAGVARHLLMRSPGASVGAPVPSLPTATSATAASTSATSTTGGNPRGWKNAEIKQLANRVYDLLVRRLAAERQRRGQ